MSMGISPISSNMMNMDAASIFKKMDADGNGGIDKNEFIAAGKEKNDANAEKIFAEFDANSDGVIDETENESALQKLSQKGAPPPPPPSSSSSSSSSSSTSYDEMDLNQDGTVSTEERLQYIMQLLQENESVDSTEYTYNQLGQSESSTSGTQNSFWMNA